ncbi:unnamed protein product [Bemisia tabaci]|uniref:Lipase domain-containing protein n=1 Tax=Bemisia tabaci TaxID=7038 RepID=A0AAI8UV14_BEMTA|nr:PREDICTED: pancreatic triacylglycerol lipase-like [Bemisia tabaci]CAH0749042.1 unnamed protein product [Bemisia tabaci]
MALPLFKIIIGCTIILSDYVFSIGVLERSSNCPKPPEECPNVNITFHLYNRRIKNYNGYQLKENDTTTLQNAPFIKNKQVIVSSHGYTGHLHYAPNPELIDAYNRMPDPVNIIVINWGRLCPQPCYTQSARNVALVGNCSALFIEALLQHQTWFTLKDIHFIGFSLGAQVMSQISHKLTIGKPYWITALDPAWPLFDTMTTYAEERLDITDADFLDVYHTNAGYKGQLTSIGHVDFYANHALLQPGCGTNSSCNHVRAVYYYAESIYTKVGFYAYSCLSILTHLTGFCKPGPGDELVLLGAHVNHSTRGTYYFTTNDQYPFARGKVFDTQEEPIQAEHHMQSVEPVQPMQRPLPIDLRLSEIKASPKPSS